jgi:ferredoxin-NADP reductase
VKLKFVETRPVSPGVQTFIFEPLGEYNWVPGQYMHLNLPHPEADDRGLERWFTVSSAPFEGHPALTTRMDGDPRSTFKDALANLEPGQEIESLDPPEGDFVLEGDGPFLLVAGGIGVTPYHSMLAQAAHEGKMPKVHLLYGGRVPELPFREEFDEYAAQFPELTVEYVIEPQQITPELIIERAGTDAVVYVSGPEPMVEAFDEKLKALGLPENRLKNDFFPGYTAI